MKLQNKLAVTIIPVIWISIFTLGYWATETLNEATRTANYRYLNKVSEFYFSEQLERLYSLLDKNHLTGYESFTANYQKTAIEAAIKIAEAESGYMFIVNKQGDLLLKYGLDKTGKTVHLFESIIEELAKNPDVEKTGHIEISSQEPGLCYSARYFSPWNWVVIFATTDERIYTAQENILKASIGLGLVCAVITITIVVATFRFFFIQPVEILKQAAISIMKGKSVTSINIKSHDELGELARGMERMSHEIEENRNRLLNWQATLEQKVSERTIELNSEIEQRMELEKQLRKYEKIVSTSQEHLALIDKDYRFQVVNGAYEKAFNKPKDQIEGRPISEFLGETAFHKHIKNKLDRCLSGEQVAFQEWFDYPNGSQKYMNVTYYPSTGENDRCVIVVANDITMLKSAEKEITQSLKEKETLLQEIHHRVKNNMQIVTSLLKLQSRTIEDERAKMVFKESQNRIFAMAAVHDTLYQSGISSKIDVTSYLSKISRALIRSFSSSPDKVKLIFESECNDLDLSIASPLGLIVNELLSNSLKYAFPENRGGEIKVRLKQVNFNSIRLTVSDNGIGLPKDFDWKQSNTLGLRLIRELTERQLKGEIMVENKNGVTFSILLNTLQ